MAHSNSPLGQYTAVIPASSDAPDVAADFATAITAIEKKALMSFATRTSRNSTVSAPVDGMVTYIQDVDEIDTRINGAWVKTWPVIYSGSGTPSGGLGVNGDLYIQTS